MKKSFTEHSPRVSTTTVENKVSSLLQSFESTFPLPSNVSGDALVEMHGKTAYVPTSKGGKGKLYIKYTTPDRRKRNLVQKKIVDLGKDIADLGIKLSVHKAVTEHATGEHKTKKKSSTGRKRTSMK